MTAQTKQGVNPTWRDHGDFIENHLGEAQAITVALRTEHQGDVLLLDELAACAVAKQLGIRLSGFPGVFWDYCKNVPNQMKGGPRFQNSRSIFWAISTSFTRMSLY